MGLSFLGKFFTFKNYTTGLLSEEPIKSELQEDSSTFLTSLVTKNHMMALPLPSPPLNLDKHSSSLIQVYQVVLHILLDKHFYSCVLTDQIFLACQGNGALGVSATLPRPQDCR